MVMQIVTEHGKTIEFNKEKHVYIHKNQYVVGMSTILGHQQVQNLKIGNYIMKSTTLKKKWKNMVFRQKKQKQLS